ncbi:hypothetical protein ZIOFF_018608 [Zingiber officinale]|uniref:Pentatricopeptide repeat-containing protein n=1 Tax=Zingiber officinale TaxID=94328 RepID=A0A8J5LB32_ZINOF|nr:hypothetical protein ZIOFF_018608 [Zingiber officinale]
MEGFSELNLILRGTVEEGKRVMVEVGVALMAHGGEEGGSGVKVADIESVDYKRVQLSISKEDDLSAKSEAEVIEEAEDLAAGLVDGGDNGLVVVHQDVLQRLHHEEGGCVVEPGGGLVEEEESRPRQDLQCDAQSLLLPAIDPPHVLVPDQPVCALLQLHLKDRHLHHLHHCCHLCLPLSCSRKSQVGQVETYSMLLAVVLRRIGKPTVSYVYLHSVRLLVRQMKSSGMIPDTIALNLIITAYARCLEMEEVIQVFREMGLYRCEPNEYSYGYIVQGLCQKGWLEKAMNYFKEMRSKALVPTTTIYMAIICSLSLERRLEAAVEVVYDMLENYKAPNILTNQTLLEEMCREGRLEVAYNLLEELRQRKGAMKGRMQSDLLASLHWVCQPRH